MTFVSRNLPRLDRVRGRPGRMGLRPHSVTLVIGTYSGDHTGDGFSVDDLTPILAGGQNPKVRWMGDEELALGGLPKGTCTIGPITPGIGLTLSDLTSLTVGATRHLRIVGPQHPDGALYAVKSVGADRALHYTLVATPVSEVIG